jgi:hypothetical protein
MNDELDRVVQRTRQYWFADGLVELSVGGTFIILGLYFYLQSILPSGSLILFTLQAGFVLLLFGIIFLSRYLVNKFKARLTFPRSGYVSYKRATRNQRILSASVALIIASLNVVLFVTTPLSLSWIPAVTGSIVAVVWLMSGVRTGLLRFYLQALISVLLGAALSLLAWETYLSLAVYYSTMGLILIASGGLTLSKYLRQSPPIENETPAG